MTQFCVYSAEGRILRSGMCATADVSRQAKPGEFALKESANDLTHYVVSGGIVARPAMPVLFDRATVPADGGTPVTFTQVPTGAEVSVSGPVTDRFTTPDGTVELTFDLPGTYRVKVARFPFLDWEGEFVAT